MIFHYKDMTEKQREFLKDMVTEIQKDMCGVVTSLQIGGGCVLSKNSKSQNTCLDYVDVISAVCKNIYNSNTHKDPKIQRAICNVLMQRIGGLVHTDRSRMNLILQNAQQEKK